MNIGLDFDDTIAHFTDEFLSFYNKKNNKKHQREEFKDYNLEKALGITKEETNNLVFEFHESQEIDNVKPIEGAIESIIHMMHNGDKLYIITARPSKFKKMVEEWIKHHIKTNRIEVIYSKQEYNGKIRTKGEICRFLKIKLIFEDSGENALDCAKKGIKVILFNKPWNQNFEHKNIKRVNTWKESIKIIMDN